MILLVVLSGASALAGYGDPVGGYPSAEERALVLWTNAARVDPKEFTSDYKAGGCSTDDFSGDEKTAKDPLYIDIALTEAARFHSADMEENGCFQHESCDGTDTWTRIGRYYDEGSTLGENIAYGSADPRYTVLSMWMCSHSGHRANIMSGDFNEMGGGVASTYMTQDFAGGKLKEGEPPMRVAAEYEGAFWADWGDDDAPESIKVVVNGDTSEMKLKYGEAERGIYVVEVGAAECDEWYVEWETRSGESGTFPATGAFLANGCEDEWTKAGSHDDGGSGDDDGGGDDDSDIDSLFPESEEEQVAGESYQVDDVNLVCASAGGPVGGLVAGAAAVVATLSRRRGSRS